VASFPLQNRQETLDGVCTLVLDKIASPSTRAMYGKALYDFLEWRREEGSPALSKAVVQKHRIFLIAKGYSASSINQRLTALRQLAARASEEGVLPVEHAVAISRIKGARQVAAPTTSPLTSQQAEELMNAPDSGTIKGQRDRALLALLVGCGLRRNEIVRLNVDDLQRQGSRWVLVGVIGTHRKARIVPLPHWAKLAIDKWLAAGQINEGAIFRAVDRQGAPRGRRLSSPMVLEIVKAYGKRVELRISPRGLRRTCAMLCRSRGADLEQIQLLLGHSSIQMTEQFLGTQPKPVRAPNDRLGLRWRRAKKLAS
jgi:site-specific recombinase XerD